MRVLVTVEIDLVERKNAAAYCQTWDGDPLQAVAMIRCPVTLGSSSIDMAMAKLVISGWAAWRTFCRVLLFPAAAVGKILRFKSFWSPPRLGLDPFPTKAYP